MASNPRVGIIPDNYTVFEREMSKAVENRLNQLTHQILMGIDVDDFPAYKHLAGYIKAYNEVVDLMVQVRDRINKLESGRGI